MGRTEHTTLNLVKQKFFVLSHVQILVYNVFYMYTCGDECGHRLEARQENTQTEEASGSRTLGT